MMLQFKTIYFYFPECPEDSNLDLVLIVDGSGSICNDDPSYSNGKCDNWIATINFLVEITQTLQIDQGRTHVGMVLFATTAELRFNLDA